MNYLRFVLILFACGCLLFGIAFAQDDAPNGGTIRGQITELTPEQNPIKGVEVKIIAQAEDGGNQVWATKTDADGNYKHAGLPAGRYLISISKDGYDTRIGKPVSVVEGGEHFVPLKMAQKGDIQQFFEVQQERKHIAIKQKIKPRVESLLQGIAESVSRRYDLDPAAVDTLRLSILESVEIALKRDGNIQVFEKAVEGGSVGLLKVLLSRLDCKVLFAEHLSEAQLQDYVDFTEAPQQREQQVVARRLTMLIDKELSLRAAQREKIAKMLRGAAWNEAFPVSMSTLRISSQQAIHLVHYRLKVSLDALLSETQSKVWQKLVNTNANRARNVFFMPGPEIKVEVENEKVDKEKVAEVKVEVKNEKVDKGKVEGPDKKRPFIPKKGSEPVKIIRKETKIMINEVVIDPPGRLQPWIELNPVGIAVSPEQMMEIAEAKLIAHTELLGALDERAARRLALVAKGVAQQYTEAQDKTHDAMDELWGDEGMNIDITDHPMYQQAIKDVLSEEAFAQYSTYRAEREVWHQQVLRDLVVACMDTQLLLGDTQREALETAASQLIPGPLKEEKPAEFMFFQLFPQTVNFEILTLWQQNEFKRVFGPMMWRR